MLLALLLTLGQVRVEFAPADDVVAYRVERADRVGQWRQAAVVAATGRPPFVFEAPTAVMTQWRVFAVDMVGNESPPAEVDAATWACTWRPRVLAAPVPISCFKCSCELAGARIDEAVRWLLEHEVVTREAIVRALVGLRVIIGEKRVITLVDGTQVEGVYFAEQHTVMLAWDGSAALHELLHAAQVAAGVAVGPGGHGSWEDGRLKELDERFRYRFRGRSLWARRSR